MMDEFIIKLIQDLLNSSFCQNENSEAASNTSFLEKALSGSGAEFDMIKDCESTQEIKEAINQDRAMFNSFIPDNSEY